MSDDEMRNHLSVIIREIGEMKQDFIVRFEKLETLMGGLEASMKEMKDEMREMRKDLRALTIRFDRFEGRAADTRADVAELEDRVTVLEGGQVGDRL